jgi:hypothetical protein
MMETGSLALIGRNPTGQPARSAVAAAAASIDHEAILPYHCRQRAHEFEDP